MVSLKMEFGDQATWVISLPTRIQFQRIASAAIYRSVALGPDLSLIGVERLDVSSVVLVEVRQFVVEIDMWSNVVRNIKLKGADRCSRDVDGAVWWSSRGCRPLPLRPGEV